MTQERLELTTEWGVQQLMAPKEEGEIFYYHQNHQGSPSFISTTSGFLTEHMLLLAYGEVFVSNQNAASWQNPYSFTGKEQDQESGLHYFGARYYLAEIGLWLSTDPLADQFANVSPYAYAANNPAFFTDRWGLAANPPAWWSDFQSQFRQMFSSATENGETRYGGYSSVVGEITAPRMTWAEKQARRVADVLHNMPTIAAYGNFFYNANACFVDVGGGFIGSEADFGIFFVLTGDDKGKLLIFKEVATGGSPESGGTLEIGRVDANLAKQRFKSDMLYGDRQKTWLSYGIMPYASVGGAVSTSIADGVEINTSSFQFSIGPIIPLRVTGGHNFGKIIP